MLLGSGFRAVHLVPWQIVEARFRFLENGEEFSVSGIIPVAEVDGISVRVAARRLRQEVQNDEARLGMRQVDQATTSEPVASTEIYFAATITDRLQRFGCRPWKALLGAERRIGALLGATCGERSRISRP